MFLLQEKKPQPNKKSHKKPQKNPGERINRNYSMGWSALRNILVLYAWLLVSWQKSMVPFSYREEKEKGVKFFLMDSFSIDWVLYLCVSSVSPKNEICYSISKIHIYA